MASSSIKQKTGDCSQCGAAGVHVAKIGKQTLGINCCYKPMKAKQYSKKALENKIRKYGYNAAQKPPKEKKQVGGTSEDNLQRDLDIEFSRYIRLLYANRNGVVNCYTCDYKGKWFNGGIECGHFIPRANMATRWEPRNCRPQCNGCNCHNGGNLKVFAERLEEEQKGLVQQLNEMKHTVVHFSNDEMKQMLIDYRKKVRLLMQNIIK